MKNALCRCVIALTILLLAGSVHAGASVEAIETVMVEYDSLDLFSGTVLVA